MECPGTWLTLVLEGWDPGDGVGVFVEAAEEGLVVEDVPEAVLDFFESDVFLVERLGSGSVGRSEGGRCRHC